ncbi:sugar phosphate isomerase/epimerase [Cohnella nanjingensis]|uniref:Sugar phosphate isomerase/epimerase n=1 Tax=Cohnella nanjingensis TaxID=1387779 RepID=A0A7X0RR45_9BACL|nr:sugar phosphate isomerase/epimerase [Cohnella nanjingensis]MBB6672006.1 sugar phosphate isomerase/epimerase [Cohnella nanjingensis]
MNRFIIGQYGGFDDAKYRRDFRPGFYGIEACMFGQERDEVRLREESQAAGFRIGVHFPFRSETAGVQGRDALFLAGEDAVRLQAYDLVERELAYVSELRPSYVLFHYPKPVILDDRVDWSPWRFDDRSEYALESAYPPESFRERSERLFAWLSRKGEEYRFTPVLELDALNRYVYEADWLTGLLDNHPRIRLCLDTIRLYLQDRIDPRFDAKAILNRYAKYAETVHLSNMQMDMGGQVVTKRYPVLPWQDPRDGWAPIGDYLRIIRQENPGVKIMFEHRSDFVSDEELSACYEWVDALMNA